MRTSARDWWFFGVLESLATNAAILAVGF